MKKYLSRYWIGNCIIAICAVAALIIWALVSFIDDPYKEDSIIFIVIVVLIFVFVAGIIINAAKLYIRYVQEENEYLVMRSIRNKKLSSVKLTDDIYYEILPMKESGYSGKTYIILSNQTFESFQKRRINGIGKACKLIDSHGNLVIMRYDEQYVQNILNKSKRHILV